MDGLFAAVLYFQLLPLQKPSASVFSRIYSCDTLSPTEQRSLMLETGS